jgi:DAACS family dicarboxylate/amino acid:cation (Na+ or H+) symporter
VITAIGAAGVPGGSLPLIMVVLATVGVPPEAIAIILGVDRILDMSRTVLNVTGDLTATCYVARTEAGWDPKSASAQPEAVPTAAA